MALGRVFPGTTRNIWIVAPSEPGAGGNPALLVFNDGGGHLNPDGPVRARAVIDALTSRGTMPPTVAAFVTPGRPVGVPGTDSEWQR